MRKTLRGLRPRPSVSKRSASWISPRLVGSRSVQQGCCVCVNTVCSYLPYPLIQGGVAEGESPPQTKRGCSKGQLHPVVEYSYEAFLLFSGHLYEGTFYEQQAKPSCLVDSTRIRNDTSLLPSISVWFYLKIRLLIDD